ncbi:hypothetical protein MVEN_01839200 [Mycena venus]|uniref:Uncharacterized protein n=1 Tax=Mycena venus TaxID=2733690 RepID=A0A8H6XJ49_9AGAR|nr:hypothetical protein MVEN_01839200 [Mycena venus]
MRCSRHSQLASSGSPQIYAFVGAKAPLKLVPFGLLRVPGPENLVATLAARTHTQDQQTESIIVFHSVFPSATQTNNSTDNLSGLLERPNHVGGFQPFRGRANHLLTKSPLTSK